MRPETSVQDTTLRRSMLGRPAFSRDARNCLLCRHIDIWFGEEGYSELTPGSPGYINCFEGVFGCRVVGACDLVKLVSTAEICEKFQPSAEAVAMISTLDA